MSTKRAPDMDEARQPLEEFAAGRLNARTFQARYLAVWRDMRDRGEPWTGEAGRILAAIFDLAECYDSDLAPGEPTNVFTLDEPQFRAEVLDLHRKLHALPLERV